MWCEETGEKQIFVGREDEIIVATSSEVMGAKIAKS